MAAARTSEQELRDLLDVCNRQRIILANRLREVTPDFDESTLGESTYEPPMQLNPDYSREPIYARVPELEEKFYGLVPTSRPLGPSRLSASPSPTPPPVETIPGRTPKRTPKRRKYRAMDVGGKKRKSRKQRKTRKQRKQRRTRKQRKQRKTHRRRR